MAEKSKSPDSKSPSSKSTKNLKKSNGAGKTKSNTTGKVKGGTKNEKRKGGRSSGKKKGGKRKKKGPRLLVKRRKKPLKRKCYSLTDPRALMNTYYTMHGAVDLLRFRKFKWKKKKKAPIEI